jgi:Uma2 family endonuclease
MPTDPRTAFDAATSRNPEAPPGEPPGPEPYKFSLEDAYAIGETGVFRGKRVELIGGQFLVREPPSSLHAGTVKRLLNRLRGIVGADVIISAQDPVVVSPYDVPEPDIAILKPRDDFYTSQHPEPEDVYLVIEVANTSLRYDQSTKASLYAAADIDTYWIVDVNAETICVHTDPGDETFENIEIYERGDTLTVPVPTAPSLPVSDLFPEPEQNAEDAPGPGDAT